jgi:hypothetical protein
MYVRFSESIQSLGCSCQVPFRVTAKCNIQAQLFPAEAFVSGNVTSAFVSASSKWNPHFYCSHSGFMHRGSSSCATQATSKGMFLAVFHPVFPSEHWH